MLGEPFFVYKASYLIYNRTYVPYARTGVPIVKRSIIRDYSSKKLVEFSLIIGAEA